MKELIESSSPGANVRVQWGVRIPLRDGIHLNATLYSPRNQVAPSPVLFTLTPYIGQTYHDQAVYFAAHGYPFLTVDVRGRGNSEGIFKPHINEAKDGHDVVEWLARQPYCDGQVAMWGGSYGGLDQWNTARELPPHLATIVPVASPWISIDFPMFCNVTSPYVMQWLMLVSGRTSQDRIFADNGHFWNEQFRVWFESGSAFNELDSYLGNRSEIFQEWISHPQQDTYWDGYNPTAEQYAEISVPILTITGSYDGDQPGALTHYRKHIENAAPEARARHYLIIGPWDHAGTRTPRAEFGGLRLGQASLVDLANLHLQWYSWIMGDGPRPEFLQKAVAYYVMGLEQWRYADSIEEITARSEPFYLQSSCNPVDVFSSGSLGAQGPLQSDPDHYVHDPRDVSLAALESTMDPESLVDQRMIYAAIGKQLIYHSAPFEQDTEISGFFRLAAWIAIDQPDTDFRASVYEVDLDGSVILLTTDFMRARHRRGLRTQELVRTREPLRYDFERFMFVSRRIKESNRLRLVIGPINSIFWQRNYNGGGVVSEESIQDARSVTVRLFHDRSHPSALYVPFGQPLP
jgi:putative CocE/NonD family hydrolase